MVQIFLFIPEKPCYNRKIRTQEKRVRRAAFFRAAHFMTRTDGMGTFFCAEQQGGGRNTPLPGKNPKRLKRLAAACIVFLFMLPVHAGGISDEDFQKILAIDNIDSLKSDLQKNLPLLQSERYRRDIKTVEKDGRRYKFYMVASTPLSLSFQGYDTSTYGIIRQDIILPQLGIDGCEITQIVSGDLSSLGYTKSEKKICGLKGTLFKKNYNKDGMSYTSYYFRASAMPYLDVDILGENNEGSQDWSNNYYFQFNIDEKTSKADDLLASALKASVSKTEAVVCAFVSSDEYGENLGWASNTSGEDSGVPIPTLIAEAVVAVAAAGAVAAGVAGAGAASSGSGGGADDEKKRKTYRMVMNKDFGNGIKRGGPPQLVYARIVGTTPDGTDTSEDEMTRKITITLSDGNALVTDKGTAVIGGILYKCAEISVPAGDA